MLTIRAMSDGTGYSARHLQHSDYYAEGQRVTGQWQGRGAEMLGLAGEVQSEQFEALRGGLDPQSGEFLRQRHSADRTAADGSTQSRGRNLYDFTISAPKSVSIMTQLGGDTRLVEAYRKAVQEALKELEYHAASRIRVDGANDNRMTGNLVLAVYHHDTSRELDPQLHTHAVAANLTYDGAEGRWKALQASGIYEQRAYLTEVYRNALAREVRSLGYEIEDRRSSKGKNLGFEIKGISDELLEKYSQRSEQRDRAIAEFVESKGRQPSDNEIAVLVRESRADKLVEISTAEVHSRQTARLTREESLTLEQIRETVLERSQAQRPELERAYSSLDYAKQHVFERVSVALDHELLTEALRHGRGRIDLSELKGEFSLAESKGDILRAGKEVATRGSLDRERDMIERINRGTGQFERLGLQHEFTPSARLRPEQKQAIESVLDSRDLAVNIRGAAGTGKTVTLQELQRGLEESCRQVLAVAPTMSAVEELQKVGFSDAITVERLLQSQSARTDLFGKALIVDEAGMVSGRQMSELLKLAEQQSTRIIFSGDTRQIQSVEASDALRVLERESHLKSASLSEVQRQTTHGYRDAIQELRRDPERGFDKLEQIGAVREVSWSDRAQAVQQAYSETQANADGQPRSVLVVAATLEEIGHITEAIRAERTRTGELGQSTLQQHHVPLNWTTAEKGDVRNYAEGQVLEFHRAAKGVARHESLEVVGADNGKVVARNARAEERGFTAKQAKCFEVYERRAIEIAPNDKLLLMANRREPGFRATNGELVTVSRIDEQGRIHLQDGRCLPENYKQFTHGYAVTAHRSQGKSVDAVVISADAMRKELFYVAASRGRESITVVTSDRDLLRESVAHSVARQSASELSRKARGPLWEGLKPSLRERERRELSVAPEQGCDNTLEKNLLRRAPAAGTAQGVDVDKLSHEEKQEHIIEPVTTLASAGDLEPCSREGSFS
ncbi:MAG TPA: MobF family relaxase [Candidatus Sulfotelmatobacter sp.]|nr:MobF family relaxase [Candidatus Sulfotelmatobacter sp.]